MKRGDKVTTRYFGGYERVEIVEIEADYPVVVVSRFGGQGFDYLPKDQIEKIVAEGVSDATH